MAYYNFYKIIKDLFRTIFGNKILKYIAISLLFFFILFLFNGNKVFASTSDSLTTVSLDNNLYDLDLDYITNQYNFYFLCWRTVSGKAYLDLFCSDEEMTFYSVGNNKGAIAKTGSELIQFHVLRNISPNNSFDYAVYSWNNTVFEPSLNTHTYTNGTNINISQTVSGGVYSDYWTITLANYDVKDQNNNTVFENNTFKPPTFDNITEIRNGYPDGIFISRRDYSENEALYFHLLKITYTVPDGNQSTYYYDDKVFLLRKDTKYYCTYPNDTEHKRSYYYIPRSELTLDTNSSYLYVLSNNSDPITTTYDTLQVNVSNGIYDVIESDTSGVITEQDALNDKIANINNNQQETANNSNNINNFLNENTVSNDTNGNIDTSLNFNNSAPQFNSLFNGYFSRLASIISELGNYQDTDVITISIPIPFTNNTIPISSDFIFSNNKKYSFNDYI